MDSHVADKHKKKKVPRQKFTAAEDAKLIELVNHFGLHSWKKVASLMESRSSRQCRERYSNYLSPELKNGPWTAKEDRSLIEKVKLYGQRWSIIARYFPTRSDVNLKNRYALFVSKGKAPRIKCQRNHKKVSAEKILDESPDTEEQMNDIIDAINIEFQQISREEKSKNPLFLQFDNVDSYFLLQ